MKVFKHNVKKEQHNGFEIGLTVMSNCVNTIKILKH